MKSLVHDFQRDGFCVVKNALTQEQVAVLLRASDAMTKEKTLIPGKMMCIVQQNDEFVNLLENPNTFPVVVKLLQHYNIHCYTSQFMWSPPNTPRLTGWHTDGGQPAAIAINGISALLSVKVAYALTDVKEENMGNLEVVPGSHLKRLDWRLYSFKRLSNDLYQGELQQSVQLKLSAGDAVIFDQRLWHAAAANESPYTRKTIYIGYAYGQIRSLDYDSFPEEFLQRFGPITRQLLGGRATKYREYSFYAPEPEDVPLLEYYKEHFGETWI